MKLLLDTGHWIDIGERNQRGLFEFCRSNVDVYIELVALANVRPPKAVRRPNGWAGFIEVGSAREIDIDTIEVSITFRELAPVRHMIKVT